MIAPLLAMLAVSGVALHVEPQSHLSDARWPSHAFVTLPAGWVKPNEQMFLLEDGKPIASQIEVAARWPDQSPKWVHAYAAWRYTAGKPAAYELEKRAQLPGEIPASPLRVVDKPGAITVETGAITLTVARPFAGVTIADARGTPRVQGGGAGMVDGREIAFAAQFDDQAEIIVEQQGPAQVTIKCSGWYHSDLKRVAPICRFVTRITVFAGSNIVKFDQATAFADDMHKYSVGELPFRFAIPNVQGYTSGELSGRFDDQHLATYFAQLAADRLLTIDQRTAEEPALPEFTEHKAKSPGWFVAELADARVALLTKDFWQKFPKEVKVGRDELVYYAWPRHGALARQDADALRWNKIYKFQCFHTGRFLDSRLPDSYFTALQLQTDTTECKAEFARAGNLCGVAMHNEFALAVLPRGGEAPSDDKHVAALHALYLQNPIARVTPAAVAASGVLGPVAASGRDFPEQSRTLRDGMLGYAHTIARYGDYGWAIYGNTHHVELMHPQAAGIAEGRPSLHRCWTNNHYQHVSTAWRLYALHGDPRLLDWARTCTDTYSSIGQVRYDSMAGHTDGKGDHYPGPTIKFHNPGSFYHCKGLAPWGLRDYGMDRSDADAGLRGHWPDPSGLLYAWLYDANRWAKDGYDLWRKHLDFHTTGANREINCSLLHAMTAHEYQPADDLLAAIKAMSQSLRNVPILKQKPGPIWEPTWMSRYYEMFPEDEEFKAYLLKSVDELGLRNEGIWTLALSATAYRITGDDKYLRRHGASLLRLQRNVFYDPHPDKRWDRYGLAPSPSRDGHFMLQWHRFLYALRQAKIESLEAMGVPAEPGHYLHSPQGTRLLVLKEAGRPLPIELQGSTLAGGDIHATSMEVLSPAGASLLKVDRLPMSAATPVIQTHVRPSTWDAALENYAVKDAGAGLYSVLFNSYQFGVYQPLTGLPECEPLRSQRQRTTGQECYYLAQLSRGHLVPVGRGRIALTFTALGRTDGSHIAVYNSAGEPLVNQWLRAGDTVTVNLTGRSGGAGGSAGPWLLDAFSDHSGYFRMDVAADTEEPLLYGSNLDHIQQIRQRLGR
ncbi:MAG: hypothetical protein AB7O59_23420 [Pirellulales bacterium]